MERAAGVSAGAPVWHAGSCHCGRVRIEALAPPDLELLECNCSMCSRSAYLHLIVAADEFRLVAGANDLTEYSFGTGVARHRFCRHCGVKSFYTPRSHPDGFSVNARCLDPATVTSMRIRSFDGLDWERARTDLDSR
jgi:hypothetical protein